MASKHEWGSLQNCENFIVTWVIQGWETNGSFVLRRTLDLFRGGNLLIAQNGDFVISERLKLQQ